MDKDFLFMINLKKRGTKNFSKEIMNSVNHIMNVLWDVSSGLSIRKKRRRRKLRRRSRRTKLKMIP